MLKALILKPLISKPSKDIKPLIQKPLIKIDHFKIQEHTPSIKILICIVKPQSFTSEGINIKSP